ncbi:hypothetical protein FGO68_gene17445 [Halteria grandinella]|uniref:Uncharacterized protein n=1 Tax=Halteria grandinella TaxID=5974 RepID=A0A8J8SV84_HALGN|nr:hypothetical protein FGO68_gene17445 [Halteria grandinella]
MDYNQTFYLHTLPVPFQQLRKMQRRQILKLQVSYFTTFLLLQCHQSRMIYLSFRLLKSKILRVLQYRCQGIFQLILSR